MPHRPAGQRAVRAAIANFKGGAGKSTVALHLAHAAALDGARILCVELTGKPLSPTRWACPTLPRNTPFGGIMARDLLRETERMNAATTGPESGTTLPQRQLPASITGIEFADLRVNDFIKPTSWPTIDIVPG